VDSTQVGILKESDEVCLSSLLEGEYSGRLKTEIGFEILCDLTDKTLERCPVVKRKTYNISFYNTCISVIVR
jgi:hypothetical protein